MEKRFEYTVDVVFNGDPENPGTWRAFVTDLVCCNLGEIILQDVLRDVKENPIP